MVMTPYAVSALCKSAYVPRKRLRVWAKSVPARLVCYSCALALGVGRDSVEERPYSVRVTVHLRQTRKTY